MTSGFRIAAGFRRFAFGMLGTAAVACAAVAHASGPQFYAARCATCHGVSGEGNGTLAPRLNGRVSKVATKPEGRRYLILVMLNGMFGAITVDGKPYRGVMAPVSTMSDDGIADLLTHIASTGKAAKHVAAFTGAEVAKVRAEGKRSISEVAAERARLAEKGLIP